MEQVYRRRSAGTGSARGGAAKNGSSYRQTLIRQAGFSLLLFVGCLFAVLSPHPGAEAVKNSIRLIVDTHTDFRQLPSRLQASVLSLLSGGAAGDLGEKDLLTTLVLPVEAPVTSPFGTRTHPTEGEEAFHYGVDLGAPEGEKIKCAAGGVAAEVGESPEYGKYIAVQHSESIYTLYAHCSQVLPAVGDTISAGQVIATAGATGNATGPHLHFEIRDGDTWLDPAKFLPLEEAGNA